MSNLKIQRHIGRLSNTGSTVVVVMNQIEGKEDHALIVESDTLPPKFRDEFADMINSRDAQQTPDLANLLHRRVFGSTGRTMLSELHNEGYLRTEPVSNITMLITKRDIMPLSKIVDALRLQENKKPFGGTEVQTNTDQKVNMPKENEISKEEKAKNLLVQAQILEADAKKLAEEAFDLDPSLKPKRGRPKK